MLKKILCVLVLIITCTTIFAEEGEKGGLALDLGVEATTILANVDTGDPDWDAAIQAFQIIWNLRIGVIADLTYNFGDVLGIGVETGILMMSSEDQVDGGYNVFFFNVPLYAVLRVKLGPLFLQPHAGLLLQGATFDYGGVFVSTIEVGSKVGLKFGKFCLFGDVGLIYATKEDLFTDGFQCKVGLGAMFEIL